MFARPEHRDSGRVVKHGGGHLVLEVARLGGGGQHGHAVVAREGDPSSGREHEARRAGDARRGIALVELEARSLRRRPAFLGAGRGEEPFQPEAA